MVSSSHLCKQVEGAGSPFQVAPAKGRVSDSIDTLNLHKADHRSRSSAYFHETELDDVGGAYFLRRCRGKR